MITLLTALKWTAILPLTSRRGLAMENLATR
jgi:hypothetical protein